MILITLIAQTILWIITGVFFTAAQNIFSFIILYTGGMVVFSIVYMVSFLLLCVASFLWKIFLYIRVLFTKNSQPYKSHTILIVSMVLSITFIIAQYPVSIYKITQLKDIFKFSIVYFHLTAITYEILCLFACDFSPLSNLDCICTVFATLRIVIAVEQLPVWNEVVIFFSSPPGTYDWEEMGILCYSCLMEIPLAILFYIVYELSVLRSGKKYELLSKEYDGISLVTFSNISYSNPVSSDEINHNTNNNTSIYKKTHEDTSKTQLLPKNLNDKNNPDNIKPTKLNDKSKPKTIIDINDDDDKEKPFFIWKTKPQKRKMVETVLMKVIDSEKEYINHDNGFVQSYTSYLIIYTEWILFLVYFTIVKANYFVYYLY